MQAVTETGSPLQAAAPTASSSANSAVGTSPPVAADFQDFLQLLTAQLRNQDPLSPLDSTQFVAQLASFSSVEQLVASNQRLDDIAAALVGEGLEKFGSWIGRAAETAGGAVRFEGEPVRFRIAPDSEADRIEAVIKNESGAEIYRIAVRNDDSVQEWDGSSQSGAAPFGRYNITIDYITDGAAARSALANSFGIIEEVRLNDEGIQLRLSNGVTVEPENVVALIKS